MARIRAETHQRRAVAAALRASSSILDAQDLYVRLQLEGSPVSLSTIYRALRQLIEAGVIEAIRGEGTAVGYRCCTSRPHRHLLCRSCRRIIEVDYAAVRQWAARLGRTFGFVDLEVTAELWGTCAQCQVPDLVVRGVTTH